MTIAAHFPSFERAENQAGKAEIKRVNLNGRNLGRRIPRRWEKQRDFPHVAKGVYECNDPPLAFTRFS
jgi:hypothetical protein